MSSCSNGSTSENQTVEFLGDIAREDLKKMLLIRNFELTVLDLFSQGLIKGTTHTCLGQEYIPVALDPLMQEKDFVISHHRGHGHYIARYGDVEGLLSEITGKEGAVCSGIGGSQHIHRDRYLSTGIQGEGIAVAAGISWSYKFRGEKNICFVYIGDGTFGRGSVYESLNFAGIWNLPMVIVVENNGIAMTTNSSYSMSGSIRDRARAFDIAYQSVDSHNVHTIRQCIETPIKAVRETCRPLLLEFKTERIAAHSKGDDSRSQAEMEEVMGRYWYYNLQKQAPSLLSECEDEVKAEIKSIVDRVSVRKGAVWQAYENKSH